MKKFLIISAPLLVSVFFVMAVCSASNMVPSGSGIDVLTNSPTSKETNYVPGTFAAKPYSLTVVVPKSLEEKMPSVTNALESKTTIIKPKIRLEKR